MCGAPTTSGLLRSCVNWYLVAGGTYLPWGTPCSGSVLAGTATLLVSIPRGYCAPCSYCICDSWSVSYSCFICGSYLLLATLATCPALAACPIQFSLPNFVTPGPRMSPVTVFAPSMLGMFPDGGVIRISLWRGPGLFALFSIKRGGLSFGYCLVETLLALAVQVPYSCKQQWHQGHRLYWDIVCFLACLAWSSISHRSSSLL